LLFKLATKRVAGNFLAKGAFLRMKREEFREALEGYWFHQMMRRVILVSLSTYLSIRNTEMGVAFRL
jgi:hypothetical protein